MLNVGKGNKFFDSIKTFHHKNRSNAYSVLNVRVQLPGQSESFVALCAKEIFTFIMRLDHVRSESFSRFEILSTFFTRECTIRIDLQIFAIIDESSGLIRLVGFHFVVGQHVSFQ